MANKRKEITEEMLQKAEELAAIGYPVHLVANALLIGKTLFYNNTSLMDAYKKGRSLAVEKAVRALFDSAEGGDTTAAIFLLKTIGFTRSDFNATTPETAQEVNSELSKIYQALATGEISEAHGDKLVSVLDKLNSNIETAELEQRIEALEGIKK